MLNNRRIAMPAIYWFDFPSSPTESGWGWHRATELMEALEHISRLRQGSNFVRPPHPWDVGYIQSHIRPQPTQDGSSFFRFVNRFGKLEGVSTAPDRWLEAIVDDDGYLPARLGMQLIGAAKGTVASKVRKVLSS